MIRDRLNSVDLELEGREIVSITNPRPRVSIEVNPDTANGRVLGYNISVHERGVREDVGLLGMEPYNNEFRNIQGNRLHLWHLEVEESFRNMGFGTVLFNIYKEYALQADFDFTSIRVGNGSTKDFLIKQGVNERFLHTNHFPAASEPSTVLTDGANMRQIQNLAGIVETSEQINGVFVEDAFEEA